MLALCMVLCLVPTTAFAEGETWESRRLRQTARFP